MSFECLLDDELAANQCAVLLDVVENVVLQNTKPSMLPRTLVLKLRFLEMTRSCADQFRSVHIANAGIDNSMRRSGSGPFLSSGIAGATPPLHFRAPRKAPATFPSAGSVAPVRA